MVTTIIDVTLLSFAAEIPPTGNTGNQAAICMVMSGGFLLLFVGFDVLHTLKERLADKRLMDARKRVISTFYPDYAAVERVGH